MLALLNTIRSRIQVFKMVAWSSFGLRAFAKYNLTKRGFVSLKNDLNSGQDIKNAVNCTLIRGHKTMAILPSKFAFNKFKDMFNFYLLLGVIPLAILITYCNIFIGPATLAVIPEGYEPKPWEYHRHPITRFFAKYLTMSPQESHERNLHNAFYNHERFLIRQLECKIETLMKERLDYQAYYMDPRPAKYPRLIKDDSDKAEEHNVQTHGWVK